MVIYFVFISTLNSRFQCNLCRDVLAVLKCAVSIHIFPLDAASVLLTYRKHGQVLLQYDLTCMVFIWLYRPYYSYYYYHHTVPHTDTLLIFSNKDCSFLPNPQCAFCWFSCVLPFSLVCSLWDKPSLHVLSLLPCFYNTFHKWLLISFGAGQTAYPFNNTCKVHPTNIKIIVSLLKLSH